MLIVHCAPLILQYHCICTGTGLDFIPETILDEFINLTSLSLSKNQIALLADNAFENLTSLRSLDLSQNHLTSVSQQLLVDILGRENVSVDLSGNPFSCTCDLLWFIEEYKKDADRKEGEYNTNKVIKPYKRFQSQRHLKMA